MATLALQHHWLLPINCHFDDCKARLVRFPCKKRYIKNLLVLDIHLLWTALAKIVDHVHLHSSKNPITIRR